MRVPTNNSVARRRRRDEAADLFRQMLPVGIENNHVLEAALQPVTQAGLDRLAFALVVLMHDHFRAGRARVGRGRIGRTVIDHEDVIELLQRPLNDSPTCFSSQVGGDDRRDRRPIHRARGR